MSKAEPNEYFEIKMTYAKTGEQDPTTSANSNAAIRNEDQYGLYDVASNSFDSKPPTILREHAKEGSMPKNNPTAVSQSEHPANAATSRKVKYAPELQPQPSSQNSNTPVYNRLPDPQAANLGLNQQHTQPSNRNNINSNNDTNISRNNRNNAGGETNQDILLQLHPQNLYIDEVEMARLRDHNNLGGSRTNENEANEQYAVPEYDRRNRYTTEGIDRANYHPIMTTADSSQRTAEDSPDSATSASKNKNDSDQKGCSSPCQSTITVPKWAAIVVYASIILLTIVSGILIGLIVDLRQKYSDIEDKLF